MFMFMLMCQCHPPPVPAATVSSYLFLLWGCWATHSYIRCLAWGGGEKRTHARHYHSVLPSGMYTAHNTKLQPGSNRFHHHPRPTHSTFHNCTELAWLAAHTSSTYRLARWSNANIRIEMDHFCMTFHRYKPLNRNHFHYTILLCQHTSSYFWLLFPF